MSKKLNLKDEEIRKQYRNSFDWFGFGLESDDSKQEEENSSPKELAPKENKLLETKK